MISKATDNAGKESDDTGYACSENRSNDWEHGVPLRHRQVLRIFRQTGLTAGPANFICIARHSCQTSFLLGNNLVLDPLIRGSGQNLLLH
jgi:hypothetical protein